MHFNTTHAHASRLEGTSSTYNAWAGMIQRCHNENHPRYSDYGGRGIVVANRWRNSFTEFLNDMGECPEGHILDREDNDQGYNKDNCRWVTPSESNFNKRTYSNNKSGCKGVSWKASSKTWVAHGRINSRRIYLGSNRILAEAIKIRQSHEDS